MTSLPRLSSRLLHVLGDLPEELDGSRPVAERFIQRKRQFSASTFVQTLVFGWGANPTASLAELAAMASVRGVRISAQGLNARFGVEAAQVLQGVLDAMLREVIASEPVPLAVLTRFSSVYLLDSTLITLPNALERVWQGFGNAVPGKATSAVKAGIRLDLRTGQLDGPELTSARVQDRATPLQHAPVARGSVRIADRGYFSLPTLTNMAEQGGWMISYLQAQIGVLDPVSGEEIDVARWLQQLGDGPGERSVLLGKQAHFPARLIALPLHLATGAGRRKRVEYKAKRDGTSPNSKRLAWADWEVVVTNVPADLLAPREALALLRARWQIELLFKFWKSTLRVDSWRTANPDRIYCEILAKCIVAVVHHWFLVIGCWQAGNLSYPRAGTILSRMFPYLLISFAHPRRLHDAVTCVLHQLAHTAGRTKRKTRPNTWQVLANPALIPETRPCLT